MKRIIVMLAVMSMLTACQSSQTVDNGTRSRLNQIEGEMYRDAAMQIIRLAGDYSFRELDYSKESYE